MGFGTVFSTMTFIIVFVGVSVLFVSMQRDMADSAKEIVEEQKRINKQQRQSLNILSSGYAYGSTVDWKTTYSDEFAQGTTTNTTTQSDAVQLNGAEFSGTYTSEVYNTGHQSNYTTIDYSSVEPGTTTLRFQIRSHNTTSGIDAASFLGPDGTTGTFYSVTGTTVATEHETDQLIQYRAYFTTTDLLDTALLQQIEIGVTRGVGHITLQLTNDGSEKFTFEETDVYVGGIRLGRNASDRVLEHGLIGDTRLWNPSEQVNVTAFYNLTAPTMITVSNEFAKDQTQVSP